MSKSMMIVRILVCFILLLATISAHAQSATQKFALILGNAAYSDPNLTLDNPVNDLTAMSDKLEKLGFNTFAIANFTKSSFEIEFQRFLSELRYAKRNEQKTIVTIFYAGHGIQYQRVNYLVPIDTQLMQQAEVNGSEIVEAFISLEYVSSLVAQENPELAIVILDACRDLPFSQLNNRIGGWTNIVKPNFFVAFGTGPGEQAFDGVQNGNSVFVSAILKHIDTVDLNLAQLFQRVRQDVMLATDGTQVPQESSRAVVDFSFNQAPAAISFLEDKQAVMSLILVLIMLAVTWQVLRYITHKAKFSTVMLRTFSWLASAVAIGVFLLNIDVIKREIANLAQDELVTLEQNKIGDPSQTTAASDSALRIPSVVHNGSSSLDTDERGLKRRQALNAAQNVSYDDKPDQISAKQQEQRVLVAQLSNRNKEIVDDLLEHMIRLEPGQLELGSTQFGEESKPVIVQHVEGFSLLSHEVTNGLYQFCIEDKICQPQEPVKGSRRASNSQESVPNKLDNNRPVTNISYQQIVTQFLPWLNSLSKVKFRLPTEVEWEYAAKYLTADPFNEQLTLGEITANCNDCFGRSFGRRSAPIKSYTPTPHGFYDLLGNVSEWVASCWTDNYQAQYYGESWPNVENCDEVVVRGGAWHQSMKELLPSARQNMNKIRRSSAIGFRLAR